MPTKAHKPIIFISYAEADEPENPRGEEIRWLSFVRRHLQPAIKHRAVEIWTDRPMLGDNGWDSQVERKLRESDIFVLLTSRNSLSSKYVGKEISIIRERQAKGEDVLFYPLLLTPTPNDALTLVRDAKLRAFGGKPLSDYPIHERDQQMSDAANEIAAMLKEILGRRGTIINEESPARSILDRSVVAARERGRDRVEKILSGEDMLTVEGMAELLGTTRMAIDTKRQSHQLLALEGRERGFHFPRWQVGDDGKPFDALPALFDRLGGSPWAVYRFLVQHHAELGGLTGREALAKGQSAEAVEAAESVAEAFS